MINSMTGFGQSTGRIMDREVSIEMRSVNNRFRDVIVRLPKNYSSLEDKIKNVVAGRLSRGRVEIWVQVDESAALPKRLHGDTALAEAYLDILRHMKNRLKIPGEIELVDLIKFRDIFTYQDEELDLESFMKALDPFLQEALDKLIQMRQTEGQILAEDFLQRLADMEDLVERIGSRREQVLEELKIKLENRIKTLLETPELDQNRLHQEVAYMVDRSDITEELVRLHSHLAQFREIIPGQGPVGRRLEFILQEMNREVNTIGSKSQDVQVSKNVVDLKTELEKLREQVQNVE